MPAESKIAQSSHSKNFIAINRNTTHNAIVTSKNWPQCNILFKGKTSQIYVWNRVSFDFMGWKKQKQIETVEQVVTLGLV